MKKTAVVTGASRGIGRAAAIALAKDFNVVVNCRKNIDLAEKTAEKIIKNRENAAESRRDCIQGITLYTVSFFAA